MCGEDCSPSPTGPELETPLPRLRSGLAARLGTDPVEERREQRSDLLDVVEPRGVAAVDDV